MFRQYDLFCFYILFLFTGMEEELYRRELVCYTTFTMAYEYVLPYLYTRKWNFGYVAAR